MNTPTHFRGKARLFVLSVFILIVLAGTLTIIARHFWPFTESAIRTRLSGNIAANIDFGSFHKTYFPPGCVAENVVFNGNVAGTPLISIRRLTISSDLSGLLHHRATKVRAEGMHVVMARSDFARIRFSEVAVVADEVIGDDVDVKISQGSQRPLQFVFREFRMDNLGGPGPTKFAVEFNNPMPAGLVRASGQFGPWNKAAPPTTDVSGRYSLENADLGVFKAIGGRISTTGNFHGTFEKIDIEGATETPELKITETQHSLPLKTHFNATVNAINGEATLKSVEANFGEDLINAQGSVARRQDGRRTAIVDLTCEHGRVEDTFYPFIRSPRSPLSGDISFQMHVEIRSGEGRFIKKINLSSNFRIWNAEFTNPQTEVRLSKVSERPHQKEPDNSAARVEGQVVVNAGIAHFHELSIQDEDASAWLRGSYALTDESVDLHGKLKTEASITKATSGIKAVFAKALEPLFAKRQHVKIVPIKVSGTFQHPKFGLDMSSTM